MIEREQRQRTVHEEVTVRRCCDFCQKEAPSPGRGDQWSQYSTGDVLDVTIEFKEGWSCPDGGEWTIHRVDCCPECWKEKVVPWLASLGVTPRQEEHEF